LQGQRFSSYDEQVEQVERQDCHMPRFFIEKTIAPEEHQLRIEGDDAHHIRDVLRLRPGEELMVCDGTRTDLVGRIHSLDASGVTLEIISRMPNQTESPYETWLFQGLPKSDKMDSIIQKAVELGVTHMVPVQCQRSVVRLEPRDFAKKLARWNRIAQEAAKQCGRGILPEVGEPLSFRAAVDLASHLDLALVPWENERDQTIRAILEARQAGLLQLPHRPRIGILIGPEGGFALDEIDRALASGLQPVSLGRRILRTETAGPAVLAMLGYQFNDF
jgi:16S rRNA (uracil1498-N3)-methyltransferase